jgi:hypothetical protein
LFPRLNVPGPVLEIVAGVVPGPAVVNAVHADTAVQALSTTIDPPPSPACLLVQMIRRGHC